MLIDGTGRIAAVGPRDSVGHPPGSPIEDLGTAILLPGLVNTHTHLELTGFPATANSAEFPDWILSIRRLKEGRSRREFLEAAKRGLRDCWAGGVTTIADTGDTGAAMLALYELGGSGIAYQEVFGPDPGDLQKSLYGLKAGIERKRALSGERVRLGVSPHAPYTVSGPLFVRVSAWARETGLPLAVHIAESRAESEFVTGNSGRFAEAWRERGIPLLDDPAHLPLNRRDAGPPSPVGWLSMLGVLGPSTLCIHAINLSAADILLLQQSDSAVAHCPVSNQRHGHERAPGAPGRAALLKRFAGPARRGGAGRPGNRLGSQRRGARSLRGDPRRPGAGRTQRADCAGARDDRRCAGAPARSRAGDTFDRKVG